MKMRNPRSGGVQIPAKMIDATDVAATLMIFEGMSVQMHIEQCDPNDHEPALSGSVFQRLAD